jgi:hypothetical protein
MDERRAAARTLLAIKPAAPGPANTCSVQIGQNSTDADDSFVQLAPLPR